jgi:hypothetical protein
LSPGSSVDGEMRTDMVVSVRVVSAKADGNDSVGEVVHQGRVILLVFRVGVLCVRGLLRVASG